MPAKAAPLPPEYAALTSYYRLEYGPATVTLTDFFPENECYHNRLYMLLSAWQYLLGPTWRRLALLEVAGSSGYYGFHALRQGFAPVVCLEGRPEYGRQLELVGGLLDMKPRFVLADVEDAGAWSGERFDVVLAQGILHHIYDHLAFVKGLHRVTGKLMMMDVHLNGRMDACADMWVENPENIRDSPYSGLSLCPSLTVLVSLLKHAGFRRLYRVPYPRRIRDGQGYAIDPYRYRSLRRIMLACIP